MNNEEKIRLVLETLGVDSVRQANKELRDLTKSLAETERSAGSAAGQKGGSGQGILQLAFAIDDLQYGIRGIVNNIPQVVQALGLGAGFAGAAGIAAVALNQLVIKHPEWFEWSEKVRSKLVELNDVIKAEEAAIKRQKDAIDKLGESNSTRIEDILKLKSMTEDLQAAEDQLDKDRKNRKAAEDAAKNQGVAADEEFAFQKDITKQLFTDTGMEKQLYDEITRQVEASIPAITNADIAGESGKMAAAEGGVAYARMTPEQRTNVNAQFADRARTTLQNRRGAEVTSSADALFGGIIKPKDQAELDDAMGNLSKLAPQIASTIKRYYDVEKRAEEAQKELDSSIEGTREATAKRKKDKAEFERQLNSGMEPGAQLKGLWQEDERRKIFERKKAEEDIQAENAAFVTDTSAQLDPAKLAAMRLLQTGGRVNLNLKRLEQRDRNLFGNALLGRGMTPGYVKEAATAAIDGGEEQLEDFAEQIGAPMKTTADYMRVATMYLQKLGMNAQQVQEQMMALQMQVNMMSNGAAPPMRPQTLRARE
jgi:hypothetical protein